MRIFSSILAAVFVAGVAISAHAAEQASAQDEFEFSGLNASDYTLGERQYLVYFKDKGSDAAKWLSLWTRSTAIVERAGEKLVEIRQIWRSDDPRFQRELYSLNRIEDFAPVLHITKRGEEGVIEAYQFSDSEITGAPGVEGNTKTDFSVAKAPNTLNWELDMETFALLPLKKDAVFNLNFYHPGSKTAPQAYEYKIIGEDVLTDYAGRKVKTWMLKIEYGETDNAIFWLDQKTGEMLKMEEVFGDMRRYKVRLGVVGDEPEMTTLQ